MLRRMCIRAKRDDLAAKLPVAPDNPFRRVRMPESILKASGVNLNSFAAGNQLAKNLINDILLVCPAVILVSGRTVTNHIIKVPVHIKAVKGSNIFKDRFKIFPVAFLLHPSLIKA